MTSRRVLALLVGASLPLLWATAALGHAVVQPAFAPSGEETRFRVLIPHGCAEGEPPPPPGTVVENTRLVSVEIPDGLTVMEVEDARGFETEEADDSITWRDGDLENGDPGEFFFTALVETEDGTPITFNVFQECTDDLTYRWAGAQDDSTPAPTIMTGVAPEDAASEEPTEDAEATEEPTEDAEATEEPTAEPTEDVDADEPATAGSDDQPAPSGGVATGAGGTAANPMPLVVGGLAVALLGAAGLLIRRRQA